MYIRFFSPFYISFGYQTSHDWDCYSDCEDRSYTNHSFGLTVRNVFIGIEWIKNNA